jgi:hypothetical protein
VAGSVTSAQVQRREIEVRVVDPRGPQAASGPSSARPEVVHLVGGFLGWGGGPPEEQRRCGQDELGHFRLSLGGTHRTRHICRRYERYQAPPTGRIPQMSDLCRGMDAASA